MLSGSLHPTVERTLHNDPAPTAIPASTRPRPGISDPSQPIPDSQAPGTRPGVGRGGLAALLCFPARTTKRTTRTLTPTAMRPRKQSKSAPQGAPTPQAEERPQATGQDRLPGPSREAELKHRQRPVRYRPGWRHADRPSAHGEIEPFGVRVGLDAQRGE